MPRVARSVVDGGIYHILNRGNGRQRVFHRDADYLEFENLLWQLQDEFEIDLYAYCLMPNHFHLLLKVRRGEDLSRGMQWFTTTHVRRYHRLHRSSGHVWQGRYKSFIVEEDNHYLTVVRYIEGNPVRANMVETATDWVWSSHRERCGLAGSRIRGLAPKVPVPDSPKVPVPDNNEDRRLVGTGSKEAWPREKAKQTFLAPLLVEFSENWTTFVDRPLTGKELGQIKKRIDRQMGAREEGAPH